MFIKACFYLEWNKQNIKWMANGPGSLSSQRQTSMQVVGWVDELDLGSRGTVFCRK